MENWDLVVSFVKKHWPIGKYELLPTTRLHEDLGIKGDDADIFMYEFSQAFNVKIDINLADYFEDYKDDIFSALIRMFRRLFGTHTSKTRTLTLGDMAGSITTGKLDDVALPDLKHGE